MCVMVEQEIRSMYVQRTKSAAIVCYYHVNMEQECFQHLVVTITPITHAVLEAKVLPSIRKLYLIKWPLNVYVLYSCFVCVCV